MKEGGEQSLLSEAHEANAAADEATYLELMKKAIKQRQKQQKLALLLGPNVPPAPHTLLPRKMLYH